MIELGQKVRDRINGFEGTVTGVVNYITGCKQFLVAPRIDKDGKMQDSHWIDGARLEVVDPQPIALFDREQYLAPVGPDAPAPTNPSH